MADGLPVSVHHLEILIIPILLFQMLTLAYTPKLMPCADLGYVAMPTLARSIQTALRQWLLPQNRERFILHNTQYSQGETD